MDPTRSANRVRGGSRSTAGRLGALALAAWIALASACSASRRVADGEPRPRAGADVQVWLTPVGAVRLAQEAGRTERVLQGRLVEDAREVIVLAVPSREEGRTLTERSLRQVVLIPWEDVQTLEVKEFSAARTGQFAIGLAAVAYVVGRLAFSAFAHQDTEGDPPGNEIPLITIRR